jgi:DNA ligase-1
MEQLYCLDKNGGIREFSGDVISSNLTWGYSTRTGKLDGKLIIKDNWIKKGKQGRSTQEQAEFELASAYKEKQDEGYKSLAQLQKKYYLVTGDLSNILSMYDLYKGINLGYNTNPDWLPLPMLAEKWRDFKHSMTYPALIQPKFNGVRCISSLSKDGMDVILMSRGGDYYDIPHIKKSLLPILQKNPSMIFDGELYNHDMPLQTISGAARLKDLSLFNAKQDFLKYYIYDIVLDAPQTSRDAIRYSVLNVVSSSVFCVMSVEVQNEEQVTMQHDKFVARGYEGIMVRAKDGEYSPSFRSRNLLKVKSYLDEEFEIVGCEADTIDPSKTGESFVFVMKNNTDEQEFKARPTGSIEQKKEWYDNILELIGKKATVRFQERSLDGLPMQGHVRHKDSKPLLEHIIY